MTMADYIKREDGIRELNAEGYTKNMRIHKRILDIPAANVRENVRGGEWILDDYDDYYELWKCSACGNGIFDHRYAFCPNCGADMRLRDKE